MFNFILHLPIVFKTIAIAAGIVYVVTYILTVLQQNAMHMLDPLIQAVSL